MISKIDDIKKICSNLKIKKSECGDGTVVEMNFSDIQHKILSSTIIASLLRAGVLPSKVRSLKIVGGEFGENCFKGCDGIKEKNAQQSFFTNLAMVEMHNVKKIPSGMFSYTPIEYFESDIKLKSIEGEAFECTPMLDEIKFYDGDKFIPNYIDEVDIDMLAFNNSNTELAKVAKDRIDWEHLF